MKRGIANADQRAAYASILRSARAIARHDLAQYAPTSPVAKLIRAMRDVLSEYRNNMRRSTS